jgi:hypothetical protein
MGKAIRWKAKATKAKKKCTATRHDATPNNQHRGWGKKAHQPTNNNHHAAQSWVDVVHSGGINVQIVLANNNLGTTQPETRKKERRHGAAHQLGRKRGGGERGRMQQGTGGPENHDDNGEGKRNKGQPGAATPVQTGHLGQKMRDGHKDGVNGVAGPTP